MKQKEPAAWLRDVLAEHDDKTVGVPQVLFRRAAQTLNSIQTLNPKA
jgi:hypothetical protein